MSSAPAMAATDSRRGRGWFLALAALVLALGMALRLLYYDNPHGHSDEEITVQVVRHMRQSGDWDDNWAKADLTPDMRYDQYNFSTHLYATFFFYRLTKLIPGTDAWRGRDSGFAVYRMLVALLASLSVLQTFQLGRRVGGRGAALGAALLAGLSTLLVQDAHYVRPEALTTVLMLAVAALSLPGERFRAAKPVAAAFCIGLLIACKVSMLLVAWVPLVPVVGAWRQRPRGRVWVLAAVGAATLAGFAGGAPAAVAHPSAFIHGVRALTTQYAGLHPPHSHLGGGPVVDIMMKYFAATLGLPALLCFVFGAWTLIRGRRWGEFAVVAGPVLLFAGYFATRSVFFERNLSHVLPLFCILAAFGAVELVRRFRADARGRVWPVAGLLCLLLAIRPAVFSLRLVFGEYPGRAAENFDRFEASVRARFPGVEMWSTEILTDAPLARLDDHFRAGGAPLLLRATDFHDDFSRFHLRGLTTRFDAEAVGDFAGSFAELPACTLHTYHSARERYYLVRGVRNPPRPP